MKNKIASYLGFAIKSRSIVFGYDNLRVCKASKLLVLYDDTLPLKVQQKVENLAEVKKWNVVKLDESISSLIDRNCKVLGVTNHDLSEAILNVLKGDN